MAENKKGFMLYADQKEIFSELPDEIAGQLIKLVFSYVNDENPKEDDLLLKIAFTPIKHQLKRDLKKYQERCNKNRDNVRKRWNKKDTKNTIVYNRIQPDTKHTDIDNDTDKGNDTDSIYHIEDAYEFLKENETAEIEVFEMQQKKSFPDFNLFVKYFNNTVIKEEMEWKPKVLLARLRMLNDNWDKRPKKDLNENPLTPVEKLNKALQIKP